MPDTARTMRIGELLMHVGLVSAEDLSRAVDVAGRMAVPIGRALISLELVDEVKLQAALRAQALLREGLIELEMATEALKIVCRENIELDSALTRLGFDMEALEKGPTSELGELLLAAGLLAKDQLNIALIMRFETGMPLGRVLVLTGMLSDGLAATAINAQMMIREGKISRHDAIEALKAAQARKKVAEEKQDRAPRLPAHYWVRLGKLFTLAGILSEIDISRAVEVALIEQEMIGPVMVKLGLITNQMLDVALKLQGMVSRGALSPIQAARALNQIYTEGLTLDHVVSQMVLEARDGAEKPAKMIEMLKLAGIVTDHDVERAVKEACENSTFLGKMLVASGVIDEPLFNAAMRVELMQAEGYLTVEQAVFLLPYCKKRGLSLDEGLEQLGWTRAARLDWRPPEEAAAAAGCGIPAAPTDGAGGGAPAAAPPGDAAAGKQAARRKAPSAGGKKGGGKSKKKQATPRASSDEPSAQD